MEKKEEIILVARLVGDHRLRADECDKPIGSHGVHC